MVTDGPTALWVGSAQRTRLVRVGLMLCMALVAARLVTIQWLHHEYYRQRSESIALQPIDLHARRGTITDRNGRELAVDRDAIAVYVHPPRLQDVRGTSIALGAILGIPAGDIEQRILQCTESFMYVDRQADAALKPRIVELMELEPQAIGTEPATQRVYPKGTLAADLLGFTGVDHTGLAGLEQSFDSRLRGVDGRAEGERDVTGWPIPHRLTTLAPPKDGSSLRLTLDVRVQEACERELAEGVEEVGAEAGCVVVMDVRNGDVLAACDYPTFDPSNPAGSDDASWTPRFSWWIYEPGSTMKPLVAAMALADGYVKESQSFYCGGTMKVGVWTIGCQQERGGHGGVDMTGMIKYSCNLGAAQMGLAAGSEALTRLFERLRFTERITTEVTSLAHTLPEGKDSAWRATASFGQGVSITPLHLAAAYAALANGGTLMRPRFVDAAIDSQGRTKEFPPTVLGQVYPQHVAAQVVSMMTRVVEDEDGTGSRAKVPGCTVAGKTGTAQVVGESGYEAGTYVVSFAGVFPAEAPRYAVVVVLDKAGADAYGGTMAAPIFRDIAQSLITDLDVPVAGPPTPAKEANDAP